MQLRSNDIRITNIIKEYYEVDAEKVCFFETLEGVASLDVIFINLEGIK